MTQKLEPILERAVQTRHDKEMGDAVIRIMRESATYTMGDEVKAFEKEFAEFMGAPAAVGVATGTAALELAAVLSDVGPGDEVIVPGQTFVSSAVPFARRGAKLVWADSDSEARVVCIDTIAPLVTERTKAIVVVHLFGLTVDMDPILALAKERGVKVVEDCAQAPGARYKGRRVGTLGDFGIFSFHTQKNMTTLGEGGILTCARPEDAETAKKLRWMGQWPYEKERERYWVPTMGRIVPAIAGEWPYNFCLAEAHAAVGRLEIKRLDEVNAVRQRQARRVIDGWADLDELSTQKVGPGCEHVYHLFPVKYDGSKTGKTRDDLMDLLFNEYAIRCMVHYTPLYQFELFQAMGYTERACPVADACYDSVVGFPWWTGMSDDLLDAIIDRTRQACMTLRG